MTFLELKNTVILALIFASRMLGLFMILPIIALYEGVIPGATSTLIGVAAGIYGLTQALLQFPCGFLSDHIGRKPMIVMGLGVFIIGSMTAFFSSSIWGLIVGRALQGMGAIGSPILALAADLTREEVRTRAMALIGMSIGLTFIVGILLGPILDGLVGLSGIFAITAVLALMGIILIHFLGTAPKTKQSSRAIILSRLLQHPLLWRLNINIFILHAVLTACFLLFPHKIEEITGLISSDVWRFYLPVLITSILLVIPLLRLADSRGWQKKLMISALFLLGVSIVIIISSIQYGFFFLGATLFFVAFNFLEACLPATVSRVVEEGGKGAALGVYSFSQFLGMFVGGIMGGFFRQWMGPWGIGMSCLFLIMIGLTLSMNMRMRTWQEA